MNKLINNMMIMTAAVMLTAGMVAAQPTEISTAEDLDDIRNNLAGEYVLMNDIDLTDFLAGNDEGWLPIGEYSLDRSVSFTGSLTNGGGYVISGLRINRSDSDEAGLFGFVGEGGTVDGVLLADVDIVGGDFVGAVVGDNRGTVDNCSVTGTVSGEDAVGGVVGINAGTVTNSSFTGTVSGEDNVGGVVGGNHGTVSNSYATGTVSGNEAVGGVVGGNQGTVSDSYAEATVSGEGWYVGGVVGGNDGTVTNSYATGKVSGDMFVGGVVGLNFGTVTNSYATGMVSGNTGVGGVVGGNVEGTVSDSYATGEVSGETSVGGVVGDNNGSVEGCGAFNASVVAAAAGAGWGRVAGGNVGALTDNFAWAGMTVVVAGDTTTIIADAGDKDGADMTTAAAIAFLEGKDIVVPQHLLDAASVNKAEREVPLDNGNGDDVAVVVPTARAVEFAVGPSPVAIGGIVRFFASTDGTLRIYDATGNFVKAVTVAGGWDLTDSRGRPVGEGTYVVRGLVGGVRVSALVSVVR